MYWLPIYFLTQFNVLKDLNNVGPKYLKKHLTTTECPPFPLPGEKHRALDTGYSLSSCAPSLEWPSSDLCLALTLSTFQQQLKTPLCTKLWEGLRNYASYFFYFYYMLICVWKCLVAYLLNFLLPFLYYMHPTLEPFSDRWNYINWIKKN